MANSFRPFTLRLLRYFATAALVFLLNANTVQAQTPCKLKVADLPVAPELVGFSLGMTPAQVKARVPPVKFGVVDALGVSRTTINPGFDPLIDQRLFAGVRSISLEFLDDHVSSLWLGYETSFKWNNVADFVAGISQSLHLPDAWEPWRSRGSRLRCGDFQIVVSSVAGGASFQLVDESAAQIIATRRAVQAEQQEAAEQATDEVIGDKRNKVYYFERCPKTHSIIEKDRAVFKTTDEAENAGYKRGVCE